ncbi:MAG: DUF4437 domain-containing protein [Granulosicoccus sp.]|nr:DUF4437 domain-containing protein [Granulosicoccus sp.]
MYKKFLLPCCVLVVVGCGGGNDDNSIDIDTDGNADAVFVTREMVSFQDTPFPGVQLAQAFSNDDTGSHETFVRVSAGGAIPPHIHSQGTWSIVVDGPMEIPVPIDEMNPMMMTTGSAGFVPPSTEHLMGCLNTSNDCLFLIHQDGVFDVMPTGNEAVDSGTSPRNADAIEVPFSETEGWVDIGVPGVEFRTVVGDFSVQDGTQHGTLVRVQGGMGIPPHFHSLAARGFVLEGDVVVPVPVNQTNPTTIQSGGYFSVPAMTEHEMNCASASPCIFYLRQDGDFDFTPTGDSTSNTVTARLISSISGLDGAETLLDSKTGLTWVNDISFCFAGVTRPEDSNCSILSDMEVAGITDWRLPTSQEMAEVTLAVDADENINFNFINPSCAVMTASDGWVFTEHSNAPGTISMLEPGNAGVRCVSGQ